MLGYNTIMNQWQTVLDPGMPMNNTLGDWLRILDIRQGGHEAWFPADISAAVAATRS